MAREERPVVNEDGSIDVPAQRVPVSSLLSPEARNAVRERLLRRKDAASLAACKAPSPEDPAIMQEHKPFVDYQRTNYPATVEKTEIAGVPAHVFSPASGVSERNRNRILVHLHSGNFTNGWPDAAELEARPVASRGRIKVATLDYRQQPAHRFPAASEDVEAVYRELLKTHAPGQIGFYGGSAGGALTAMSMAWFQAKGLPVPGAAGILFSGGGRREGGDAPYIVYPLAEPSWSAVYGAAPDVPTSGYLAGTDPNDPLVIPGVSDAVLRKFPPTLFMTGTRAFDSSTNLYLRSSLVRLDVPTELYVWDGLHHLFHFDASLPESKEAFRLIVKFFDERLAT